MEASLIIAGAIVAVGLVLYIHYRLTEKPASEAKPEASDVQDGGDEQQECCGMHVICERDSLLSAVSDKIEYYDDEELDAYAGREAGSYTEAETEQFRDVLLTLLPDDIAGWARSIQLRGIELPESVRDELLMIISEARASRSHA